MMYAVHVTYYFEGESELRSARGFVAAENYEDAMSSIVSFYGEELIEKVTIESFAPDSFLEFDGDSVSDTRLFNEVYNSIKERVIW